MKVQIIQNKIHEIRGRRVMLDFDLAQLYEILTKVLKQAVKRNIKRFPDDFMFELTKEEWYELVTNRDQFIPEAMRHSYVPPFAFTEHGVAMLASVLRSETAVNISIQIVRAFVAMREYITTTATLTAEVAEIRAQLELLRHADENNLEAVNDLSEDVRREVDLIYTAISELSVKLPASDTTRNPIGFRRENE